MYVVPSFPEALHLAGKLCANVEENHGTNNNLPVADDPVAIQCWVAGGESVFNAAVLHPSAKYICLTVVDMEIDTNMLTATEVARFPPKYHWDVKYKQIAATELSSNADESIRATHYVMQHLKGAR